LALAYPTSSTYTHILKTVTPAKAGAHITDASWLRHFPLLRMRVITIRAFQGCTIKFHAKRAMPLCHFVHL
jgi:hypothetical protein